MKIGITTDTKLMLNDLLNFESPSGGYYKYGKEPLKLNDIDPILNVFKTKHLICGKVKRTARYVTRENDLILILSEGKIINFAIITKQQEGRLLDKELIWGGRIKNETRPSSIWHIFQTGRANEAISKLSFDDSNIETIEKEFSQISLHTDTLKLCKQIKDFQDFTYYFATYAVEIVFNSQGALPLLKSAEKILSKRDDKYYPILTRLKCINYKSYNKIIILTSHDFTVPKEALKIKLSYAKIEHADISTIKQNSLLEEILKPSLLVIPIQIFKQARYEKELKELLSTGTKHICIDFQNNKNQYNEIMRKLTFIFSDTIPEINYYSYVSQKEFQGKIDKILRITPNLPSLHSKVIYEITQLTSNSFKQKRSGKNLMNKSYLSKSEMQLFDKIKLYCLKITHERKNKLQSIEIPYLEKYRKDILYNKLKALEEEYSVENEEMRKKWFNFMKRQGYKKAGNNFARMIRQYKNEIIDYKDDFPNLYRYVLKNEGEQF